MRSQDFALIPARFWQWLTNRPVEMEHIGMAAVITISTWHVSQHMRVVEGSQIVAVIMGAVLGFLNAVFAMRYFEERDEVRWPAGFGVAFSAIVSIWMQYGFYDTNSDLVPYMAGSVNLNALMFGAWAPTFEILLGWLYGVRLFSRGRRNLMIDSVKAKYEKMIEQLHGQRRDQLTTEQNLRDQLHMVKTSLLDEQSRVEDLRKKNDDLQRQIMDLRVQTAALGERAKVAQLTTSQRDQRGGQRRVKLTREDRRDTLLQIVESDPEIAISTLAKRLNVARNTVKADLEALEEDGVIRRNGHVEVI
jgi:HTH domain